jgi:hypothetical protein
MFDLSDALRSRGGASLERTDTVEGLDGRGQEPGSRNRHGPSGVNRRRPPLRSGVFEERPEGPAGDQLGASTGPQWRTMANPLVRQDMTIYLQVSTEPQRQAVGSS